MADYLPTTQSLLDPNAADLQTLNRQQAYAQALMTQGLQGQPQGQMVSGYYVKPSFTQALQPVVQALTGAYLGNRAEQKQRDLAAAIRGKQAEAVQNYLSAQTPQEKFAAGTSPYAPAELQKSAYGMITPQKLGEGETLQQLNFGTGQYAPLASGGEKTAPELRTAAQLLGINKPVSEYTPQDLAAINAKVTQLKQAGANVMNVNMGQHGFENTLKLGENFKSEPIYKTHQEVSQAYNQVKNALSRNDAAGDLAASIKINKLLDPNSVVRESEVATVANATGLLPKLANYAAQVANGTRLNPEQRKEYKKLAEDFYAISGNQYNETRNKYLQIGQQNDLKGTDTILGKPYTPSSNTVTPPVTKTMMDANAILGIK